MIASYQILRKLLFEHSLKKKSLPFAVRLYSKQKALLIYGLVKLFSFDTDNILFKLY